MAETIQFSSPKERFDWYMRSKSRFTNWQSLLQSAYRFTLPNKDNFEVTHVPGEARNNEIFDATAVEGLQGFANNIQEVLMPPFRRWATLVSGTEIAEADRKSVDAQLEGITNKLFNFIWKSNLALVANESFQELGVSTGVMMLNEGDDEDPLRFSSIPLSSVVIDEGPHHTLENFWRDWKGKARLIKRLWPEAKLTSGLENLVKNSPDTEVKLIEGTVFFADNPPDKKYLYYVQTENGDKDIFKEWRDYSPWIGFRWTRAPGEIYGRGPVIQALPFIQTVNQMVELMLLSAQYRATPPLMAASSGVINPYTVNIIPGSIISVDATASLAGGPPLQTLEYGGDLTFAQLSIENLQSNIRDMLFANPLGPIEGPARTATEIKIRQAQAVQKTGSSFNRQIVELLEPIIKKSLIILKKKGLIDNVVINGREIDIRYESPLATIQDDDDIRTVETWIGIMKNIFGEEIGVAATNFDVFPEWFAKKLGVPDALVNEEFSTSPVVQNLKKVIAQGAPAQAAPQPIGVGGELSQAFAPNIQAGAT